MLNESLAYVAHSFNDRKNGKKRRLSSDKSLNIVQRYSLQFLV
jgi:hypothetical protein